VEYINHLTDQFEFYSSLCSLNVVIHYITLEDLTFFCYRQSHQPEIFCSAWSYSCIATYLLGYGARNKHSIHIAWVSTIQLCTFAMRILDIHNAIADICNVNYMLISLFILGDCMCARLHMNRFSSIFAFHSKFISQYFVNVN
jgi:hypothetical protein